MWTDELFLRILGTSFAIRSTTQRALDAIGELMEEFALDRRIGVPARRRYALVDNQDGVTAYADCKSIGGGKLPDAVASLVALLNRTAIEEYGGFALHAGVVSRGTEVVAFPADSGGGKSTLTLAFLEAGFDYLSDEALCVSPEGAIVPYRKPISVDSTSVDLLGDPDRHEVAATRRGERLLPPSKLSAPSTLGEMRLAHVIDASFGAQSTEIEEQPASVAMTSLLRHSFNHYKDGERSFRISARLASESRSWRLSYHDPREAVATFVAAALS